MSLEFLYLVIGCPLIILSIPYMDSLANGKSFIENWKAVYTFEFRKDK